MGLGNWEFVREKRSRVSFAGYSALRVVLLFGTLAVALAMVAAPLIDSRMQEYASRDPVAGFDMTTTGSIGYKGSYTIRKSVLQGSPNSVCILRDNGTQMGDC